MPIVFDRPTRKGSTITIKSVEDDRLHIICDWNGRTIALIPCGSDWIVADPETVTRERIHWRSRSRSLEDCPAQ